MGRSSLAVCLLLLVTLSAVYEVQGTFLLRHYMRKFPRRCAGFRIFACAGMLRFIGVLQHRCPLTAPYRIFFGKLRSFVSFLNTASVSKNYDVELKGQAQGLHSAMTALTGTGGSSADSTKVINTLISMGKTLGENERSGSLIMSFGQRRQLAMSMAQWAQVISQFVVTCASKSGTTIDVSSLGIDGIDAEISATNTGSPNPASGSPTGTVPTGTVPTGTAPTGTVPTGTVPTGASMSGNTNTAGNVNTGVNTNVGGNFKGNLNYQASGQVQASGQKTFDHQATTAGGH